MAAPTLDQLQRASVLAEQMGEERRAREELEARRNTSALGDFGTGLKVGAAGLPGMLAGVGDTALGLVGQTPLADPLNEWAAPYMAQAGREGRFTDAPVFQEGARLMGEEWGFQPGAWADRTAQIEYSPEYYEGQQAWQDAEGFAGAMAAIMQNPAFVAGTVGESGASMAASGGIGAMLRGAGLVASPLIAGAVGEGVVMAGQQQQALTEAGVGNEKAALYSTLTGGLGTVTGIGGGALARRLGVTDIDTLAAGGGRAVLREGQRTGMRAVPGRVAGGAVSEGVFEEAPQSAIETVLANLAQGEVWNDRLSENVALGMAAGGVMGGGMGLIPAARPQNLTGPTPEAPPSTEPGFELTPPTPAGDPEQVMGIDTMRSQYALLQSQTAALAGSNPEQAAQLAEQMAGLQAQAKAAGIDPVLLSPQASSRELDKINKQVEKLNGQIAKALASDTPDAAKKSLQELAKLQRRQTQISGFLSGTDYSNPAQTTLDFAAEPTDLTSESPEPTNLILDQATQGGLDFGGQATPGAMNQVEAGAAAPSPEQLRAEYTRMMGIARSATRAGNLQAANMATDRLQQLRNELKDVGVSDTRLSPQAATRRLDRVTKKIDKLNSGIEAAIEADPAAASKTLRELQALGRERQELQGVLAEFELDGMFNRPVEPVQGPQPPAGLAQRVAEQPTEAQQFYIERDMPTFLTDTGETRRQLLAYSQDVGGQELKASNISPRLAPRLQRADTRDELISELLAVGEGTKSTGTQHAVDGMLRDLTGQSLDANLRARDAATAQPEATPQATDVTFRRKGVASELYDFLNARIEDGTLGNYTDVRGDLMYSEVATAMQAENGKPYNQRSLSNAMQNTVGPRIAERMGSLQQARQALGTQELQEPNINLPEDITANSAAVVDQDAVERQVAVDAAEAGLAGLESVGGGNAQILAQPDARMAREVEAAGLGTWVERNAAALEADDADASAELQQRLTRVQEVQRGRQQYLDESPFGQMAPTAWASTAEAATGVAWDQLPQPYRYQFAAQLQLLHENQSMDSRLSPQEEMRLLIQEIRDDNANRNGSPAAAAGGGATGAAEAVGTTGAAAPETGSDPAGAEPAGPGAATDPTPAANPDGRATGSRRTIIKKKPKRRPAMSVAEELNPEVGTDRVWGELRNMFGDMAEQSGIVEVVQDAEQLEDLYGIELSGSTRTTAQGLVLDGTAYFIADNIPQGRERAVIMHELGSHIGFDQGLTTSQEGLAAYRDMLSKISNWADRGVGAEGVLAQRAIRRVANAQRSYIASYGVDMPEHVVAAETIAYFIEEAVRAGVQPSMQGAPAAKLLADYMRLIQNALRRILGMEAALRPVDIVNFAHGMAIEQLKLSYEVGIDQSVEAGRPELFSISEAPQSDAANVLADDRLKAATGMLRTWGKAVYDRVVTGAAFTSDIVQMAARHGMRTEAENLDYHHRLKANYAREIEIKVEEVLSDYAELRATEQNKVDRAIFEMTMDQKWGFVPDWRSDVTEADLGAKHRKAYNDLTPEGQAVVRAVFKHGAETLEAKVSMTRDITKREYSKLIDEASSATEKAQLATERDAELDRAMMAVNDLNGPYAPLRRFGKYVVVARSATLREAEAAGESTRDLEADGDHYAVMFATSRVEAEHLRAQLAQEFGEDGVWAGEKESIPEMGSELPFASMQRLRNAFASNDDIKSPKVKKAVDKLLVDLYISTLHETNARHSQQKRHYVRGASQDMMRAFASQGQADAYLLSAMKYQQPLLQAIEELKTAAKQGGNSFERTRLRNELLDRHYMDLDYKPTPIQDKVMAASSFWMLLTSPGYYVVNMTQPWIMTQPVLGAKYGYAASANAIATGTADAAKVLANSTAQEAADLTQFEGTPEEKRMLTELQQRGTLDFGIAAELGYWQGTGTAGKGLSKVMRFFSMGVRKVEVINRMSSALAGFRLAYNSQEHASKPAEDRYAAALKYADQLVVETHGDYSNQNAPRIIRMLPKYVTQFRKFQFIQFSVFARHIHQALKGASPEERALGRAAFGWLMMNHAVLAGSLGLPAATLAAWAYSALAGDDDDPANFEVDVRRALGEDNKRLADLLLKGVPAALGVDLSGRIGAGAVADPLPFVDYSAGREGYEKAVVAATGPFVGGLVPQAFDGVDRIRNGLSKDNDREVVEGMAQLMPKGIRDGIRGLALAVDGRRLRDGSLVVSEEDVGLLDAALQGVGLPSTLVTRQQQATGQVIKYEQFYRSRTASLKAQFSEARAAGDSAGMRQAREDWQALQIAREENGFDRQPLSDLLRAPQELQRRRERVEDVGVRATVAAEDFARSLL